jgi:hypothetical protein
VPFAGGTAEQVTKEGGFAADQSADGTTLFYTKADLFPAVREAAIRERRAPGAGLGLRQRAFVPVDDGIYYIGRPERQWTIPCSVLSILQPDQPRYSPTSMARSISGSERFSGSNGHFV